MKRKEIISRFVTMLRDDVAIPILEKRSRWIKFKDKGPMRDDANKGADIGCARNQ